LSNKFTQYYTSFPKNNLQKKIFVGFFIALGQDITKMR